MPTIATNTSASQSIFFLNRNQSMMESANAKVSSGSRITNSADDAAGLAVSDQLKSDITSLETAARTTQQVEALLQIADGGLARVGDILQRMKALATQLNSGTLDTTSQGFINDEYGELADQVNLVNTSTTFNGQALIDGSFNQTVVVGVASADTIAVALDGANFTGASMSDLSAPNTALSTGTLAPSEIDDIDTAIGEIGANRAIVGGLTRAVQFQGENLDTQITNLGNARSSIVDADIAQEQTNFTNSRVLTEAAIAGVSQANEMQQSLLALLR